ncbi:FMN-binding protein [Miniimonas sp. S16]|uniref:FMN-binding protein n=1 Tax=Miniimonas sp. S16 TaxID=2171623 RepID=UPI000D528301|nr:FMN-binding protein [Miniimonas sp. S16]
MATTTARPSVRARTVRTVATATASLAVVGTLAACGGTEEAAAQEPDASDTGAPASESTDAAASDGATSDGAATSDAASSDSGAAAAGSTYADGTYTATGEYVSPGGQQSVEVTLTLVSDVVTDVEIVNGASDPQSEGYQDKFISGIAAEVVGVAIDDLDVDKVAGSSLTSGGFDDAVEQIKAEALA